jgi:hypothetical protein
MKKLLLDPIRPDSELNVYAGEPGMRPTHAPTAWDSGTRWSETLGDWSEVICGA